MTDGASTHGAPGRTRGLSLYGLLWVIVLLPAGVGLIAWFVLAGSACACTRPPDLVVVNQATTPVAIDWETNGVLGTPVLRAGGHIDVPACMVSGWSLAKGEIAARITSGAAVHSIRLQILGDPSRPSAYVVVDRLGTVGDPSVRPPAVLDTQGSLCP